jgi:hypothetical protein
LRHRVRERSVTLLALTSRGCKLAVAQHLCLSSQLERLAVEVDEDRDLRAQNVRIERLEEVVDRSGGVALEDVDLFLRDRRQEDDRNRPRLRALLDQRRGLEAVESRHLRVHQDHGDVVDEQASKGLFT